MGIADRLTLARAYFSPTRDFPFAAGEVARGILKEPCTRIGPRFVRSMEEDGDYLVVHIAGIGTPLYWPRALPLFDLYKVITESFYAADWHFYEAPETQVRPGDVVVDCGAAEGIFSLRVVERAGRVVAFEPLPMFGESLRRTFAGCPNVTVEPFAVGSSVGEARLAGGSLYGVITSGADGAPIHITTIDTWAARAQSRVDFIKADVESFEMEALRGASETIRAYRPRLAITVYHEGNNWREIRDFLLGLCPDYKTRVKGLSYFGAVARPVMIHAWT